MPEYRIFTIGSDGHFVGVPKIAEFADDEEVRLMLGKSLPLLGHPPYGRALVFIVGLLG
jgi:hypothetical protein